MRRGIEGVMRQSRGLVAHRLDYPWVAMAQIQHANAADEIDVALAVSVPDLCIAASAQGDRMDDRDRLADGGVGHDDKYSTAPAEEFLLRFFSFDETEKFKPVGVVQ
jgi:hypothetical protein